MKLTILLLLLSSPVFSAQRSEIEGAVAGNPQRNTAEVDSNGALKVSPGTGTWRGAVISAVNSNSTPLGGGGVYTGTWEDMSDFVTIGVLVSADVASATNGFSFQISHDGSTIVETDVYTIAAGTGKQFTFPANGKYFRVVYTNGVAAQSSLVIQTKKYTSTPKPSSHRIDDQPVTQDDAELVKSILSAKRPDQTYANIQATTAGNLKVSIEEFDAGGSLPSGTNNIGKVSGSSVTIFAPQAVSFTAASTAALATGATMWMLMNHANSGAIIKIHEITMNAFIDGAVTGLATGFSLYAITSATDTGSSGEFVFPHDTTDAVVSAGVTFSTGGSSENPTFRSPLIPIASVMVNAEEVSAAPVGPVAMYAYRATGNKPITLRAGQGLAIKQSPNVAVAAGKAQVQIQFTQE